jgi:hypothetical protein
MSSTAQVGVGGARVRADRGSRRWPALTRSSFAAEKVRRFERAISRRSANRRRIHGRNTWLDSEPTEVPTSAARRPNLFSRFAQCGCGEVGCGAYCPGGGCCVYCPCGACCWGYCP